jgi:hypothetical protein
MMIYGFMVLGVLSCVAVYVDNVIGYREGREDLTGLRIGASAALEMDALI